MSREAAAFLSAICENPDDISLRLVFADWLDENAQPDRAEFIRVQCDLAPMSSFDPRRPALEAVEHRLLAAHATEWAGPVRMLCDKVSFRCGLLEHAEVKTEAFLTDAEAIFNLAPIRSIRFLKIGQLLPDLLRSPYLGRLEACDFTDAGLGVEDAKALAGASALTNLRTLILAGCQIGPEGALAIASSANLSHLTKLDLVGNQLHGLTVARLFRDCRFVGLTELSLQGTLIYVTDLTWSPHLSYLRVLDVSDNALSGFSDATVEMLANCESLSRLTSLNLGHNNLGARAARAIASSAHLRGLLALNLWRNYVEPAGVSALLSSASLEKLQALNVGRNWIGPDGAKVIAASARPPQLVALGLQSNGIGDAGGRALARWPDTLGLVALDLTQNGMREPMKRALRERFGNRVRV
jgi:uncharacterized protein (TIGR02996 family)